MESSDGSTPDSFPTAGYRLASVSSAFAAVGGMAALLALRLSPWVFLGPPAGIELSTIAAGVNGLIVSGGIVCGVPMLVGGIAVQMKKGWGFELLLHAIRGGALFFVLVLAGLTIEVAVHPRSGGLVLAIPAAFVGTVIVVLLWYGQSVIKAAGIALARSPGGLRVIGPAIPRWVLLDATRQVAEWTVAQLMEAETRPRVLHVLDAGVSYDVEAFATRWCLTYPWSEFCVHLGAPGYTGWLWGSPAAFVHMSGEGKFKGVSFQHGFIVERSNILRPPDRRST